MKKTTVATRPGDPRGPRKRPTTDRAAAPAGESVAEIRRRFEKAEEDKGTERFLLRLYVTGPTAASNRAIERVREFCDQHLKGSYELEVIDIYQLPALAKEHQIVATPTLIKVLPAPLRRYIGDLSKVDGLLFGIDLKKRG